MKISALVAVMVLLSVVWSASTAFSLPLSEIDLDWFRERPLDAQWGPDPFVPKVSQPKVDTGADAPAKEPFVLTAVMMGGEKPAAILNGSVVVVGETVKGHKVVKITRKSIFLRGLKGTAEIPLKPLFNLRDQTP